MIHRLPTSAFQIKKFTRFAHGILGLTAAAFLFPTEPAESSANPTDAVVFELSPLAVENFDATGYTATSSVIGTRTESDHRDLPLSVHSVTRQLIEEQQAVDPREAAANISSVQSIIGGVGSPNQFLIRGFRAFTHLDGFRLGNSNNPGTENISLPPEMATIDRIEILKGPATVLYGRGLPGGTIDLITKKPQPTPATQLTATTGSFHRRRAALDATGPLLSTSLRYRLIATGEARESHRDHVQSELYSVYPSFSWHPTQNLTFLLQGEVRTGTLTPDRGTLFLPHPRADGSLQPAPAPFSSRSSFYGTEANRWNLEQRGLNLQTHLRITEAWQIRALVGTRKFSQDGTEIFGDTLNHNDSIRLPVSLADSTLVAFTPDHLIRFRYETEASRQDTVGQLENVFTFEHRLPLASAPIVRHQVLVSLNHLAVDSDSRQRQFGYDQLDPATGQTSPWAVTDQQQPIAIAAIGPYTNDYQLQPTEWGFTLQDHLSLGPRWHLLAGLRFDHGTLDFDLLPALSPRAIAGKVGLQRWSPRFGTLVHLTEEVALFANYAQSFAPTIAVSGNGEFIFEAQIARQWETGLKLALPDQKLHLTAAAFSIRNENAPSRIGSDALGNAIFGQNDQNVLGFETDLTARPNKRLTFLAHYSFLQAEVTGHPLTEGNQMLGTPRHRGGFWAQYTLHATEHSHLKLALGFERQGSTWASDSNQLKLPAFSLFHLGLEYRWNAWALRLNLRNLLDEHPLIPTPIAVVGDPTSALYAYPSDPRELRLSLSWKL